MTGPLEQRDVAGGYGPPGGGAPPGGGGGYGPPGGGAPPGGGGYGPPGGGGGGYGGPPGGPPPGGGGYGGPPGGGGYGGPPGGGGYGGAPGGGGYGGPPGGGGYGGPPQGYGPPGAGYPPQGFGPPGGGFPPPGGPMMPGTGNDVNTTLPLVLGILSVVLCGNFLLGVPAIIFAVIATNSKGMGNLDDARQKARVATILAVVGTALNVVVGIGIYVVFFMLAMTAATH